MVNAGTSWPLGCNLVGSVGGGSAKDAFLQSTQKATQKIGALSCGNVERFYPSLQLHGIADKNARSSE
jgi:hypothetical protein